MNRKLLITLAATAFGSAVASALVPWLINGSKAYQIDQGLVQACNEINKNCPMTLDKYTRMDASLAGKHEITYLYTLTNLSDELALKAKDKIIATNTETLRSKPETRKLLENGVTMKYTYRNAAGTVLFEYAVRD